MNWVAALRSALRALGSNWLRSILTMLGIIIGVAAVITMIAVGGGAQQRQGLVKNSSFGQGQGDHVSSCAYFERSICAPTLRNLASMRS